MIDLSRFDQAIARLTSEEMQRLIERADSDKLKKARERLEQTAHSKQS